MGTSLFLAIVAAVALWLVAMYNGLVRLRNQVRNAWSQIDEDRREETDVLVIGSGAGGASVAMRFAEAGKRVVILERGGYFTGLIDPIDPTRRGRGTLNQREDDMLARIDGGRGLTQTDDGIVQLTYGNCVGGATVHYWAAHDHRAACSKAGAAEADADEQQSSAWSG